LIPEDPAIETTDFVEAPLVRTLRRALLALLIVFMIGTAADLMLLDHHEGAWQMIPLVLVVLGVAVAGWSSGGRSGALTAMRILMVLFVAAGFLGMVLHYLGNREFQQEMDPALSGWPLIMKVMTSKAPPALAPASMIQMGLLGLLYTYQHPALRRPARRLPSD
jgi:hypothetical protein